MHWSHTSLDWDLRHTCGIQQPGTRCAEPWVHHSSPTRPARMLCSRGCGPWRAGPQQQQVAPRHAPAARTAPTCCGLLCTGSPEGGQDAGGCAGSSGMRWTTTSGSTCRPRSTTPCSTSRTRPSRTCTWAAMWPCCRQRTTPSTWPPPCPPSCAPLAAPDPGLRCCGGGVQGFCGAVPQMRATPHGSEPVPDASERKTRSCAAHGSSRGPFVCTRRKAARTIRCPGQRCCLQQAPAAADSGHPPVLPPKRQRHARCLVQLSSTVRQTVLAGGSAVGCG